MNTYHCAARGLQQRCALIRSKCCGRGYTVEVSQLERCAAECRVLDKMASEPENVPNESGGKPQEGGEGSEDLTQFVSDKIILVSLMNYVVCLILQVEKLLGDMVSGH